ncbi:hypothetical protein GCM10009127_05650 [Alteraurantiacibacter aestuarii]|uniref:SMP-30/Gluconolactonase/LRE-like region domain-containing protein n=1 Tax=Alteraurantiacibacter aestuarii TaxID=650004 RepID=A0A844ZMW0_9SPHN|nr:hypothetical protein [Alteraurantiacibacter aestuarii]MXO88187.1 hypothetical protein [Alteraurantiacibacter aestuarii]
MALTALALAACAQEDAQTGDQPAIETITLEGERLFPESITSDADGIIYAGSNRGAIYRIEPGSATGSVWIAPDAQNGLLSVFGVLADDTRGWLWVCSNPAMGEDGSSAVKTFALADGSLVASHPFPADAGPVLCNDMAVAGNGDLYATDTIGGRIFKLAAGGEALDYWAADPEFGGIDGIAFAESGALYVNSVQRHTLMQVGVEDNGLFDTVTVLETSQPMEGPDGLRPLGGNRFLQTEGPGGKVTVVTIDGTAAQIDVIAQGIDYPSSATAVNGRAWYPVGKITYLFDPALREQDPGPFTIESTPIPEAE